MSIETQKQARKEWVLTRLEEILEKRFGHPDFWQLPAKPDSKKPWIYRYATKLGVMNLSPKNSMNY